MHKANGSSDAGITILLDKQKAKLSVLMPKTFLWQIYDDAIKDDTFEVMGLVDFIEFVGEKKLY